MLTPSDKLPEIVPTVTDKERLQKERMKEILLLLDGLFEREEATVKMIIDRLYDVGSLNFVDKKVPPRKPMNRILKTIARLSKPAFRIYAHYWFKKNCPRLITNWLGGKVKF